MLHIEKIESDEQTDLRFHLSDDDNMTHPVVRDVLV